MLKTVGTTSISLKEFLEHIKESLDKNPHPAITEITLCEEEGEEGKDYNLIVIFNNAQRINGHYMPVQESMILSRESIWN